MLNFILNELNVILFDWATRFARARVPGSVSFDKHNVLILESKSNMQKCSFDCFKLDGHLLYILTKVLEIVVKRNSVKDQYN